MTDTDRFQAQRLGQQVLAEPVMEQALEWLIRLEAADAAERTRFEHWYQADARHAEAFDEAQRIWQAPVLGVAAARMDKQSPAPSKPYGRRYWKAMASAALLVLCVGVIIQTDVPLRLKADHLTAIGERQQWRLEDGSQVLLNTHSALSSRMDTQRRFVQLHQGEAYFDIAQDAKRPFEIEAGPARIRVLGTAFSVRYLEGTTEVSVQRGHVEVQTDAARSAVHLLAGDSIRVGAEGLVQQDKANLDQALAWTQGRLIFEQQPLNQVLAELRRYYPGWIISANERIGERLVTGNYRLDDPRTVVRSLAQITSAELYELPGVVVLK